MNKKWLQEYVSEIVYGGVDGVVTTFAIVAASAGASLSSSVIFVLGMANLLADGFSMGVSAYLAKRAEHDEVDKKRRQLDQTMQDEKAKSSEIKTHLTTYGLKGGLLTQVLDKIAGSKPASKSFLRRHNNIAEDPESPILIGLFTFGAFIVVGSLPVLVYAFEVAVGNDNSNAFLISSLSALFAFSIVGYFKGKVTHSSKVYAVIETVLLGAIAASIAYGVGYYLDKLVG
jgi:VIT1/CCC1 family predicted Fe2+/Mn2+ transporter